MRLMLLLDCNLCKHNDQTVTFSAAELFLRSIALFLATFRALVELHAEQTERLHF